MKKKNRTIDTKRILSFWVLMGLLLLCQGCASQTAPLPSTEAVDNSSPLQATEEVMTVKKRHPQATQEVMDLPQLPVRYQQPNFTVKEVQADSELDQPKQEFVVPVGADISSTAGPTPLRDILKRLAALKDMNISWASDVNQNDLVDVDIRADDDFFKAIDNLLRQRDYFHEVQGNTIVVKYKETRKFHVAMPFTTSSYSTGVGGDVLGGSTAGAGMSGNLTLTSDGNTFDIWTNIKENLDKVLQIWTSDAGSTAAPTPAATDQQGTEEPAPAAVTTARQTTGYYTIDRPIGLITVTAPRPLLEKISDYLENLRTELYRQISIEAKIIEVTLTSESRTGIDWQELFRSRSINFELFGGSGNIYPEGGQWVSKVSFNTPSFNAFINAIEEQGQTNILSNPKISVMNGQPALISVGQNETYISQVTSTTTDTSTSYTVTTSEVLSGLGLGVIATIINDDELILQLTPVTTDLASLDTRKFGVGLEIQLPTVNVRELSTIVRIKNGEMLVVGGLIDSSKNNDDSEIPVLRDIPLLKKLFQNSTKSNVKSELIIILQPKILL